VGKAVAAGVVLTVATLSGWVLAHGQAKSGKGTHVLEAERFVLRDAQGKVRAELKLHEGQPNLILFDEQGQRRLRLGLHADRSAGLVVYDRDAAAPVALAAAPASKAHVGLQPAVTALPRQDSAIKPAAGAAPTLTPRLQKAQVLFRQNCVSCHGLDGKGKAKKNGHAMPPNFTLPSWQASRSDAALLVSILEGRGASMPGFDDTLTKEQARDLVAYIRTFNAAKGKQRQAPTDDFDIQFQQLQQQFNDLNKQLRSETSRGG
jgi:mono/diheme cytochrome c family protein